MTSQTVLDNIAKLRAQLPETVAAIEALDVERLARALEELDGGPDGLEYSHTFAVDSPEAFAADIAREYARLSADAAS